MNRSRHLALLAVLLVAVLAGPVLAQDAPRVLATLPADGSIGVPTGFSSVVVVFDRPMSTDGYSLVVSGLAPFPEVDGEGKWLNDRTFLLKIKPMKPDSEYAVGINSEHRKGFKSADGKVLIPFTIGFKTAPTEGGPPIVIQSFPVLGQTDIDPALDQVKVKFSEPIKPGAMTLLRIGGTTPLGYLKDKRPYFEQPDILVIPVRLAPNTTYGVSVNARGKMGFISAVTGKGVLPMQLVFRTAAAGPRPPEPPEPPDSREPTLVGRWSFRNQAVQIDLNLGADGRYEYRYAAGAEIEEAKGRWRVVGKEIEVHQDGAAQPASFPFRAVDSSTLEITMEGQAFPLQRQGGRRPPDPDPVEPTVAKRLAGNWEARGQGYSVDLSLGADGSYSYKGQFGGEAENAAGRWSVVGTDIVVHQSGAQAPLKVPFRNLGADSLELQIEGNWIPFKRVGGTRRDPDDGKPDDQRVPSPTGRILFTRWKVTSVKAVGTQTDTPHPSIWMMNGDGDEPHPVVVPKNAEEAAQEPWWVANGQFVFASDIDKQNSSLYMDAWLADEGKKTFSRVTGLSNYTPSGKGTGTILGSVGTSPLTPNDSQHNVSWQGRRGKFTNLTKSTWRIENVPAGIIWVKIWHSLFAGDLQFVEVVAGQTVKVELDPKRGNWLATRPSMSPDGSWLVVLAQRPGYDGKAPGGHGGFDTLSIADARTGEMKFLWEPIKQQGAFANGPRMSPDGRLVAIGHGTPTREDLAIVTMDSLLAGRPVVRTLVKHELVFAQYSVANGDPSWSPDGRSLVFLRIKGDTRVMTGEVWAIDVDGRNLRKITGLAPNQLPKCPTWSPDGRRIAFQVLTSRNSVMKVLDAMPPYNFTTDIFTVGVDGSGLTRLTNDGLSGEPSWGR